MKLETKTVRAGVEVDSGTGAITPPIHLSTVFERARDGSFPHGYLYTRRDNPNRKSLEAAVAALEGGAAASAFASGSAGSLAIFQTLTPRDHVLIPDDVYYGTTVLLRDFLAKWGLQFTAVDMTNLAAVRSAIQPNTKLVWIETPSNPLLKITDIKAVADIAHHAGARVVCDNTFATPILQQPLSLGADLVVHASTKYLNGHSDSLGGLVVSKKNDVVADQIRLFQINGGGVLSPFDAWLTRRGLRTLAVRMRAHCENAERVAAFLSKHPRVSAVHHPSLRSHSGHSLALRQMDWFGGMVSFQLKGGKREAMAVAARVKLWTRATSLGGTESLIEHRASIEGPGTRVPQDLLRLSVGIEHAEDLIADLKQALARRG